MNLILLLEGQWVACKVNCQPYSLIRAIGAGVIMAVLYIGLPALLVHADQWETDTEVKSEVKGEV